MGAGVIVFRCGLISRSTPRFAQTRPHALQSESAPLGPFRMTGVSEQSHLQCTQWVHTSSARRSVFANLPLTRTCRIATSCRESDWTDLSAAAPMSPLGGTAGTAPLFIFCSRRFSLKRCTRSSRLTGCIDAVSSGRCEDSPAVASRNVSPPPSLFVSSPFGARWSSFPPAFAAVPPTPSSPSVLLIPRLPPPLSTGTSFGNGSARNNVSTFAPPTAACGTLTSLLRL